MMHGMNLNHRAETPILELHRLHYAYPECVILQSWSRAVLPGATLLQGDAASGKTTLLRLLAGLLEPQSGWVLRPGQPTPVTAEELRSQVFWVDPRSQTLNDVPAQQWLLEQAAHWSMWDAAALQQHLEGFDLVPHLDKPFHALSTGMRRKVWMAGALVCGAPLALVDEPLAGLDKASVRYCCDALAIWADQARSAPSARALVVAHHDGLPGVPWRDVWVLPGAIAG